MTINNLDRNSLIQAILALKTPLEAKAFLRDLFTEQELEEFAKRWKAARLLNDNVSYSRITEATGLSSTTIARVAQWLKNGENGYKTMLTRLHHINPSRK